MSDIDEAADMEIIDVMKHLGVSWRISGSEAAVVGGKQELADFFFEAHASDGEFDPFLLLGRKWCGGGVGICCLPGRSVGGGFTDLIATVDVRCHKQREKWEQYQYTGIRPEHF